MKKLAMLSVSCFLLLLWMADVHAQSDGEWKGEIVDMSCYIASGAKGPDHADCAKSCVKGGQPMGLLTDEGDLYLLAKDNGATESFEALKDLAGEKAEVKGTMTERNGVKMVVVKESTKAGP